MLFWVFSFRNGFVIFYRLKVSISHLSWFLFCFVCFLVWVNLHYFLSYFSRYIFLAYTLPDNFYLSAFFFLGLVIRQGCCLCCWTKNSELFHVLIMGEIAFSHRVRLDLIVFLILYNWNHHLETVFCFLLWISLFYIRVCMIIWNNYLDRKEKKTEEIF